MQNLAILFAGMFLCLGSASINATKVSYDDRGLAPARNFGEFAKRYRLSPEMEAAFETFPLGSLLTEKPMPETTKHLDRFKSEHREAFGNARRKENTLASFFERYEPSSGFYKPADTMEDFVAQYRLLPALGQVFVDAGVDSVDEFMLVSNIWDVFDAFDVAHCIAGKSSFLGLDSLSRLSRFNLVALTAALEMERILRPIYHDVRGTGTSKIRSARVVGEVSGLDALETPIARLRASWAHAMKMKGIAEKIETKALMPSVVGITGPGSHTSVSSSSSSTTSSDIAADGGFLRLIDELTVDQGTDTRNMCLYDESKRAELLFHYMDRFLNHFFGQPLSGPPKNGDFTWGYIQKWKMLFDLLYDFDKFNHPKRYEVESKKISRAVQISEAKQRLYSALRAGMYPLPVSGKLSNDLFKYSRLKDWFLAGIAPVSIELGGDEKVALLLGHALNSRGNTDGAFTIMMHDLLHITEIMGSKYAALRLRERRQCGLFRQCLLSLTHNTLKYNTGLFYLTHESLHGLQSAFAWGQASLDNTLFEFVLELVLEKEISNFPLFLGDNSLLGRTKEERAATCWSVDQLETKFVSALKILVLGPLDEASKAEAAFLWELESPDGPGRVADWRGLLSKLNFMCEAERRRGLDPLVLPDDDKADKTHSEFKKRIKSFVSRGFPGLLGARVGKELASLNELFAKSRTIPECREIFELKEETTPAPAKSGLGSSSSSSSGSSTAKAPTSASVPD